MRLERWRACRRRPLPQRETRSFRLRRGVARRAVYVAVSRRRHRSVRQDTPLQVRSCSKQGLAKRRGFAIYLHALPPAARPCRELPRCAPQALAGGATAGVPSASAEPLLPEGDLAGENLIACDPLLDLAPFGHAEHPEHILGRDELVVLSLRRPVVGHRSRHSLSLASPRLIQ